MGSIAAYFVLIEASVDCTCPNVGQHVTIDVGHNFTTPSYPYTNLCNGRLVSCEWALGELQVGQRK